MPVAFYQMHRADSILSLCYYSEKKYCSAFFSILPRRKQFVQNQSRHCRLSFNHLRRFPCFDFVARFNEWAFGSVRNVVYRTCHISILREERAIFDRTLSSISEPRFGSGGIVFCSVPDPVGP